MPWTGSAPNKTFTRTDGTRTGPSTWVEAKGAGVKIRADAHDTHDGDISDGLSLALCTDGGTQPSADIPWNSKLITGYGAPTSRTDAMRVDKVQDDATRWGGTAGGTGDALTVTLSPAITTYATGMLIAFKASATNTGTATLNANSVGAKTFKKGKAGGTDLVAGDITSGGVYFCRYDGTNLQLLNPGTINNVSAFIATLLDDADAAAARTTLGAQASGSYAVTTNNLSDLANAATAFGNIKQNASTSATGVVQLADQAAMEAVTTGRAVTADVQHFHPASAKFWVYSIVSGGVPQLTKSYNVTSLTDTFTGEVTVVIANDFSDAFWCGLATCEATGVNRFAQGETKLAGSWLVASKDAGGSVQDPTAWNIVGFGDL